MKIKIYCECCDEKQEFIIEPMEKGTDSEIWGDILCKECKFVVGTVTVEEEGIYDLVKVGECHDGRHDVTKNVTHNLKEYNIFDGFR